MGPIHIISQDYLVANYVARKRLQTKHRSVPPKIYVVLQESATSTKGGNGFYYVRRGLQSLSQPQGRPSGVPISHQNTIVLLYSLPPILMARIFLTIIYGGLIYENMYFLDYYMYD